MMVSTKGRYALRVMIDLAEHQSEGYVPLKEIAARQEISEKISGKHSENSGSEKAAQGTAGERRRIPSDAPGGGIYRWRDSGADGGNAGAGSLPGGGCRTLSSKGSMQNSAHVDAL